MKRIILLIVILSGVLACKKIPERAFIEIELIAINGDSTLVNQGIEFDYHQNHTLEFHYESDSELDSIYIQLIKTPNARVNSIDEVRIAPIPARDSKTGYFTYTLNPTEQCEPPSSGGLSVFEFVKIVFINKVGTVGEKTVQFKII